MMSIGTECKDSRPREISTVLFFLVYPSAAPRIPCLIKKKKK